MSSEGLEPKARPSRKALEVSWFQYLHHYHDHGHSLLCLLSSKSQLRILANQTRPVSCARYSTFKFCRYLTDKSINFDRYAECSTRRSRLPNKTQVVLNRPRDSLASMRSSSHRRDTWDRYIHLQVVLGVHDIDGRYRVQMHLLAGYSLRVAYNFPERLHGIDSEFFVSENVSAAVKLFECPQFCNK